MTFAAKPEEGHAEPFRIPFAAPSLGPDERELLLTAVGMLQLQVDDDHDVRAFEKEMEVYLGEAVHAIACSSDTAAMQLALLVAGVKRSDDVLCSALASPPVLVALELLGARPVPVDVEPHSWTMDPSRLAETLRGEANDRRRPAAVIVTNLYGQCADHDAIRAVLQAIPLPLVEDASQALGSRYKDQRAGTMGDLAVFSFDSEQIVTTSVGGMVVTRDAAHADRLRASLRGGELDSSSPPSRLDDFELSNLLAAVGRGQLRSVDGRLAKRQQVHQWYRERLAGLPIVFQEDVPGGSSNRWCTAVSLPKASKVKTVLEALATAGIEARPLRSFRRRPAASEGPGLETAASIAASSLCLPSGGTMTTTDVDEVCAVLEGALRA